MRCASFRYGNRRTALTLLFSVKYRYSTTLAHGTDEQLGSYVNFIIGGMLVLDKIGVASKRDSNYYVLIISSRLLFTVYLTQFDVRLYSQKHKF